MMLLTVEPGEIYGLKMSFTIDSESTIKELMDKWVINWLDTFKKNNLVIIQLDELINIIQSKY